MTKNQKKTGGKKGEINKKTKQKQKNAQNVRQFSQSLHRAGAPEDAWHSHRLPSPHGDRESPPWLEPDCCGRWAPARIPEPRSQAQKLRKKDLRRYINARIKGWGSQKTKKRLRVPNQIKKKRLRVPKNIGKPQNTKKMRGSKSNPAPEALVIRLHMLKCSRRALHPMPGPACTHCTPRIVPQAEST